MKKPPINHYYQLYRLCSLIANVFAGVAPEPFLSEASAGMNRPFDYYYRFVCPFCGIESFLSYHIPAGAEALLATKFHNAVCAVPLVQSMITAYLDNKEHVIRRNDIIIVCQAALKMTEAFDPADPVGFYASKILTLLDTQENVWHEIL